MASLVTRFARVVGHSLKNQTTTLPLFRNYCQYHKTMCNDASVTAVQRQLLPANVKPLHYKLTMEPDLAKFIYKGSVEIEVEVKEPSSSISLNALDLEIHTAEIRSSQSATPQAVTNKTYDADSQTLKLEFADKLQPSQKASVKLDFTGTLNDKMAGFYRSVYKDDKNNKTWVVATTQMEPTDCRRAFPCFDEPSLKATFDITLVHESHLTALSNMDVKSTETLSDGKTATSFNTTPIMSTYLVAFVVGELNYVESTHYKVPVRVYSTPGLEHKGKFSAELGARTLEFFGKKFGIDYPLPKMDMVAIHDFSAGAMENWGLVTYRVVDVLFDEKADSAATKQRVAEVVQHELAHQWFGNLVTMDWWEGLWLNEGFATWMSWYSCNEFYPEWRVWESYVGDTLQSCLALDGLRSSHPVEVPVARADEINQIFDAISYSKGSCIVKMVASYLGEDVFIRGISRYLKRFAYSNAKTSDLWQALSEESGKDVAALMDVWTSKVGYPVLTVKEDSSKSSLHIAQNRFLTTGDVKSDENTTVYPVALELRTASNEINHAMMTTKETDIKLDDTSFYKLNAQQAGLYRVLYPQDRVVKLGEAGRSGLLSAEDKIGLVADCGALSTPGYQSTTALLEIVSGWSDEKEPNVWFEMLSRLGTIREAWNFQGEEFLSSYRKFIRSLVVPKSKSMGWTFAENDDDILTQQLKGVLFGTAVNNEDPEFIDIAKEMWSKYVAGDKSAIHPNLREAVFGCAAKYGDAQTLDTLLSIYKNNKSSEGIAALRALGKVKDVQLKKAQLAHFFDDSVKTQDLYYLIAGYAGDATGIDMRWKWLQENWTEVVNKFPPSLGMLSSLLSIVAGGMSTKTQLDEFKAFFASKDTKGFDKAVAIACDRMTSRIQWVEKDGEAVKQWVANKV